jgi:hypothetical protein
MRSSARRCIHFVNLPFSEFPRSWTNSTYLQERNINCGTWNSHHQKASKTRNGEKGTAHSRIGVQTRKRQICRLETSVYAREAKKRQAYTAPAGGVQLALGANRKWTDKGVSIVAVKNATSGTCGLKQWNQRLHHVVLR